MAAGGGGDLSHFFQLFAKFGEGKSDGQQITLKNSDKWMQQAKVFTKQFTTTDTGITFAKFKTKTMDLETFQKYIEDLCKSKKMDVNDFINKLITCGDPGNPSQQKADKGKNEVTDRLTDTSKYTGSHKERFADDGKGKGLKGRADISPDDGYVQGYKNKDTYDKK